MFIQSLELNDFRNYNNLNITFEKDTNILYGDNAQGKTNVLEAIYAGATAKSHRAGNDREMIRFGCEEAHIKLMVDKGGVPLRIDLHLKKHKAKGIAVNGIPIRKISDLFGILNVVIFSPEDLNLIKDGPAERRKFLDLELCQLDKMYVYHLIQYNKVLNQRNRLLKDISFGNQGDLKETLDIWDRQLAQYGSEIVRERKKFTGHLNEIIKEIHSHITDAKEELCVCYEPNVEEEKFYECLVENREKDLKRGSTSVGPHRDDIGFYDGEIDLRKYGSQGQQRTAALSLKLSEIHLVEDLIKDMPVLLLDDVLSELDSKRQKHLLDEIAKVQTIITCTGLDEFVENRFQINSVYKVTGGTIERSSHE